MKAIYSNYDVSHFDDINAPNSFSKEIITAFLNELDTLLPQLRKTIEIKDSKILQRVIHKVKPTIHMLKIKHILDEVDDINALTEYIWTENIESKTNKILEHLKVVEAEMKRV